MSWQFDGTLLDLEFDGDDAVEDTFDLCQRILAGRGCGMHPDAASHNHDPLSLRPARRRRDSIESSINELWPLTPAERERFYPSTPAPEPPTSAEIDAILAEAQADDDYVPIPPDMFGTRAKEEFEAYHRMRNRERQRDDRLSWAERQLLREPPATNPLQFDAHMGLCQAGSFTVRSNSK